MQKNGLGFQVCNAVNDEITNCTPSVVEFLASLCPKTPIVRDMETRQAPVCNKKIKELLGFRQNHLWQVYYEAAH